MTAQVFGDYIDIDQQRWEYLTINFSPTLVPLQHRWRNNGLSADFLADYLSTFFPGDDEAAQEKLNETRDAVSYIANELLENAMKFTYAPGEYAITITMQLDKDKIRFYVCNSLNPKQQQSFQQFIKKLLTEDPTELYLAQMKNNSVDPDTEDSRSNLGYLTMLNDYGAKLAWKFNPEADNPRVPKVTTMVELPI